VSIECGDEKQRVEGKGKAEKRSERDRARQLKGQDSTESASSSQHAKYIGPGKELRTSPGVEFHRNSR